jgi:ribosomal-protein-alanine acetyltransferase
MEIESGKAKEREREGEQAERPATPPLRLRRARPEDIPDLLRLEEGAFSGDRLSRRSFQRLLKHGHALFRVAESGGRLLGYGLLLLRGRSLLGRLYSLAISPEARGQGLARQLLGALEEAALEEGLAYIRLEVRRDNEAAIALYRSAGYREFGVKADYYEDHADALRMEKRLLPDAAARPPRLPFYEQSLEFTCGPAALLMAMAALDPKVKPSRIEELRIWREATLIFMTSGHGGCDPFGLALAAKNRGFEAEILVTDSGLLFLQSVRSEEKREAMRLVQEDFRRQAKEARIPVRHKRLATKDLRRLLDEGAMPILLVSSYRIWGQKVPHWVLVTGHQGKTFFLHDPYVDHKERRTRMESANMPVTAAELERMSRYGAERLSTAVILRRAEYLD